MQQITPVLELVLMDETGSTAAVAIHLAIGSTYSAIDASATALASIVLSITGAVLVRQRIQYRAVNDTPTPAAIGSSIKRCGMFFFSCGEGNPSALVGVPGILDELITTDEPGAGVLIDASLGGIPDWAGLLIEGDACNPFGDDIEALATAYRQSRV